MANQLHIDLTADEDVVVPSWLSGALRQAFGCDPEPEVAEVHLARLQVLARRLAVPAGSSEHLGLSTWA
jgi:hypothetical protein